MFTSIQTQINKPEEVSAVYLLYKILNETMQLLDKFITIQKFRISYISSKGVCNSYDSLWENKNKGVRPTDLLNHLKIWVKTD